MKSLNQLFMLSSSANRPSFAVRRLLPTIALIVLAAACGKGDAPNAPQPTAYPKAIATITPLSGPAAELGKFNVQAAKLIVAERAAAGVTIKHAEQDSAGGKGDLQSALQTLLLRDDPQIVLVQTSAAAIAAAPTLATSKRLMVYVAATRQPKSDNPYAIRSYPDPESLAAETVARVVVPTVSKGAKRLSILRSRDEFGQAVGAAVSRIAHDAGLIIAIEDAYDPKTVDYRPIAEKVAGSNSDCVYVVGIGGPLGSVIRALREAGYVGPVVSGLEAGLKDVAIAAGKHIDGTIYLDIDYDPESPAPATVRFVKSFENEYGTKPNAVSALVYDAWSIMLDAYAKSPGKDPGSVVATLGTTFSEYQGACGPLRVTKERDIVFPLVARVIDGGKARRWQDSGK